MSLSPKKVTTFLNLVHNYVSLYGEGRDQLCCLRSLRSQLIIMGFQPCSSRDFSGLFSQQLNFLVSKTDVFCVLYLTKYEAEMICKLRTFAFYRVPTVLQKIKKSVYLLYPQTNLHLLIFLLSKIKNRVSLWC